MSAAGITRSKIHDDSHRAMKEGVYFGRCPNGHYVLFDSTSPLFENVPPFPPYDAVCLGCGPDAVVQLNQILVGEVSREERDRGWTGSVPVLIVEPSPHHGVAIKKNRGRAKAESSSVDMCTVTCDQCGEQFFIAHQMVFQNQAQALTEARKLEEQLAEEHKRKQPHSDSIKF